jgi:protein-S-isoprenylcysteine O-methyltransferase Ste14
MDENLPLRTRAWRGLAFLIVAMAAMIFLPAWTLAWWRAWLFLVVFTAAVLAITLYFLVRDPALIERRLKSGPGAETEPVQRIIQTLASAAFIALFVVCGLDRHFGWSQVPDAVAIAGDVLVVAGLGIVFLVFRENSYTAGTVEVASGQTVVASGPYAWVRHPMYSGSLVMLLGIPLALGSLWALVPFAAIAGLIVVRLIDEERVLVSRLPGYAEYRAKTSARLIPHVW